MEMTEKTRSHQPLRDGLLEEQLGHCLEKGRLDFVTDIKGETRLTEVFFDI